MDFIKKNGLGILLCICIAIPAYFLGTALPIIGGPVFAILIGMLLAMFVPFNMQFKNGASFTKGVKFK